MPRPITSLARESWPLLSLVVAVALVAVVGSQQSPQLERTVVFGLVNLILVVGLYVFVGNSGVLSFGHISFMAIGGYSAGLLSIPTAQRLIQIPDLPQPLRTLELDPLAATLVAGLAATVFSLVIAVPLMRMSGLRAGLASFTILIIVHVVASNWQQVTRGTGGVYVPSTTTRDSALLWAIVAMTLAYLFQRSRMGLQLRVSREDEVAAESIGVNVPAQRGAAFLLSAFVVGVGGALYAQFIGQVTPQAFYIETTFVVLAMLVFGGQTSLAGAVVGSVTISALSELLRELEKGTTIAAVDIPARPGLTEVGLALVLLTVLILRPRGIMGGSEVPWPGRRASAPSERRVVASTPGLADADQSIQTSGTSADEQVRT